MSSIAGRRKKTTWWIWKLFPEVTDAFEELLLIPSDVLEESMSMLERVVVLTYDLFSDIMKMNDARKQLFAHKPWALHVRELSEKLCVWNPVCKA